jgi:hypothetical protein
MPSGKKVAINYTSRDFDSIKRDLVNYAQKYYADTYRDFNEAGFGALMLDTVSYVGDILSFYLDYQANESYLDTAIEYDNVIKLVRQLGYKVNFSPSSYGVASLYVLVPSETAGHAPDKAYMPVLRRGSQFSSGDGAGFILNEDVDFANTNNKVLVATVDDTTGVPLTYAVQAYGQVVSGRTVEQVISVGDFQKFPKFLLNGTNVTDVISVEDDEGNIYYEVDNLTQNVVYEAITNTDTDDRERTPSILKPKVVKRRFTVERQRGETFIQFGGGDESSDISSAFTEPSSVVLFQNGKDYISDSAIDPTRMLDSSKLGVAPSNTSLRVVYRANDAGNVNVSANTLGSIDSADFSFEDEINLGGAAVSAVVESLEINNDSPIVGDVTLPTSEEIRLRAAGVFSAQNRAVTRQDYLTLIYAMPERFGVVKKANAIQDNKSFKRNINIYVISEDEDEDFAIANSSLKNNLKTWLNKNRMITDSIDILDAKVVNFAIEFEVIGKSDQDNADLLSEAVDALSAKFNKYFDISENLYISDIYSTLKDVDGVLDVISVKTTLKVGGDYSDTYFDFEENLSADGRMLKIPQNVVLELKFPDIDIQGVIK